MNPLIDDSWSRYQERLHEAEQWRLAQRARARSSSWFDRVRVRLGEGLIALGQHLKVAAQPAPQFDWDWPFD